MTATTPDAEVLQVVQEGAVRHLVLHRPHRRNALDAALVQALLDGLGHAEDDAATHAVVIRGAGPSFCAGADLRHLLDLHGSGVAPLDFLRSVSALTRRIERSPLPVVGAVHGHVVAGGLEIALACDVVVAEAGTLIGDGHIRNHLLPAAGSSVRLVRRLGEPTARWLALTGALVPAEQVAANGWIHEVAARGTVVATAQRVGDLLAGARGPAQTAFKHLLADQDAAEVERALELELEAFARHWAAVDVPSRLESFLARRPARSSSG